MSVPKTVARFPAASEDFAERSVVLRLARQHLLSQLGHLIGQAPLPLVGAA